MAVQNPVPNDQTQSGGSIPVRIVANTPAVGMAYSGTGGTTAANTVKTVAVANTARRNFMLQNTSSGDMWISFGANAPAIAGPSSFKIAAGLLYEPQPGYCTNQSIQIISAAAQTYSYQEA